MKSNFKSLRWLLLMVVILTAVGNPLLYAQEQNQRTVHGMVLDSLKAPIVGSTIEVKSTKIRTKTGDDGRFSINVPQGKNTLVISFINKQPQEVNIGNQNSVYITLKDNPTDLNDVVVVGYGKQKKQSVVGAIVQVKGDVLEKTGGVSSLGSALTGNLPGLTTVATSGAPGAEDPKIYIRGQSTWNNTDPLVLVDGIERTMNSVDIGSVESVSVLKDASATAVFGVKGANGVILITTKHGREGKADIRFTANTVVKVPSKLASKEDSYNAIKTRDQAIENELGVSPASWGSFVPYPELEKYRNPANQSEAERYPNIDWADQLIKNATMSNNVSVNISGGTPFVKYFTAIDYLNEGDILKVMDNGKSYKPGYGLDRINLRTNLDFNLSKTTVLTANLAGSYATRKTTTQEAGGYYEGTLFASIYNTSPDIFYPRYSNGAWGYYPTDPVGLPNSVAILANSGILNTTTTTINTDFTLKQDLSSVLKGLSARATLSLDNAIVSQSGINDGGGYLSEYVNPVTGDSIFNQYLGTNQFNWIPGRWAPNPTSVQNGSTYRKFFYQLQLEYAKKFGKHDVTAMGLFSRDKYATGSEFEHYREDWVGRVTYNYNARYFAEFNGAYNGSEKFGPNNRFAFFPSTSVGWMISNEPFMKNQHIVNTLKLRASYGEVGNDNIAGRWLYMTQWTYGGNAQLGSAPGQGSPYTIWAESASGIGNPDIHWEKVTKKNFGVDYSLLGGMISGSVDVFSDYRTDILLSGASRAVPSYFGVIPPTANLGKVSNKGYEIDLHLTKTLQNGVRLWANLNMTHAKNKIIDADDPQLQDDYLKKAGKQIGQTYSYVSGGYQNTWDQVYGSTTLDQNNNQKIPGTINMIDFNGDGVVNSKDLIPAKYPTLPQNNYNATIGADWKGFSAFVQFYAVSNVTRSFQYVSFGGQNHPDNVYLLGSLWTKDNTGAAMPMPRYNSVMPYYGTSYLFDGAYVRLKNAEVSYTFKTAQLKRIGISSFRIYLNGNNLAMWTHMPDDREVDYGSAYAYPTVKRFNLGCNLNF